MKKLIEYAQRRLDEACRNGEDALTIRYWVGYLDALRAVEKEEGKCGSIQS